jgi:hypothetical protein
LKPEQWGTPLVQEKYQGEKTRDKGKRIIIQFNSIGIY